LPGLIVAAFIIGGLSIALKIMKKVKTSEKAQKKASGGVRQSTNQGLTITLPDRTAQIDSIVKAHDPNFTASDLVTFAKNVYIDIETAWMKRDMTPVRPVLHDNLYFTTVKQLDSKIAAGVRYHYDSMVVNTAYLTSYAKDAQFEYVTIYLSARRIDWQEDEKTGKVIRGDKTTRWEMRYKMKFMRSLSVVTKTETGSMFGHNCPNCGGPIEISSSGQCHYCNSVVTTGQYSWVLSDYGTIRNDTVDEGIQNSGNNQGGGMPSV
jgi:rubrerythrin